MPARFDLDPALRDACIASIRAGSKSFHAASLLLPRRIRWAARALYAFCRASDDLVDNAPEGGRGAALLAGRVDRIYAGTPDDTFADRAFAKLVADYAIPRTLPDALIEGFAWDDAGRRYGTMDELVAYAARVASTVGVMMTVIMGARAAPVLARAADLGIAMQLTNIARDVGEDARNGRLYLPLDGFARMGLDPAEFLADPKPGPEIASLVAELLETAVVFYDRALTGLGGLPLDCRPSIRSAAYIYRDIGREIAAAGHDSITRRAHTSRNRKVELILYATASPFQLTPVRTAPTHPAAQFLVDACAASGAASHFENRVDRAAGLLAASTLRKRAARLDRLARS